MSPPLSMAYASLLWRLQNDLEETGTPPPSDTALNPPSRDGRRAAAPSSPPVGRAAARSPSPPTGQLALLKRHRQTQRRRSGESGGTESRRVEAAATEGAEGTERGALEAEEGRARRRRELAFASDLRSLRGASRTNSPGDLASPPRTAGGLRTLMAERREAAPLAAKAVSRGSSPAAANSPVRETPPPARPPRRASPAPPLLWGAAQALAALAASVAGAAAGWAALRDVASPSAVRMLDA
eukprot:Hpha_TRINITY_DN21196_c0_g1::TRINITY_DN21196_c0_g1_i1::g.25249::m.25249